MSQPQTNLKVVTKATPEEQAAMVPQNTLMFVQKSNAELPMPEEPPFLARLVSKITNNGKAWYARFLPQFESAPLKSFNMGAWEVTQPDGSGVAALAVEVMCLSRKPMTFAAAVKAARSLNANGFRSVVDADFIHQVRGNGREQWVLAPSGLMFASSEKKAECPQTLAVHVANGHFGLQDEVNIRVWTMSHAANGPAPKAREACALTLATGKITNLHENELAYAFAVRFMRPERVLPRPSPVLIQKNAG